MDMSVGQALDFEHIHTGIAFDELTAALEKIRMINAILLYSDNVCSTPMVYYATQLASVYVPVPEDFELHRFVNFAPSDALAPSDHEFSMVCMPALDSDYLPLNRVYGTCQPCLGKTPDLSVVVLSLDIALALAFASPFSRAVTFAKVP